MPEPTPKRLSWLLPDGTCKTSWMITDELERIANQLKRHAKNQHPTIDLDQLALDIWLENSSSPSNRVRSRLIDAIRSNRRRTRLEKTRRELWPRRDIDRDLINHLANSAQLSNVETTILYLRFWQSKSFEEISSQVRISKTATRARFTAIIQRLYLANQNDGF